MPSPRQDEYVMWRQLTSQVKVELHYFCMLSEQVVFNLMKGM